MKILIFEICILVDERTVITKNERTNSNKVAAVSKEGYLLPFNT